MKKAILIIAGILALTVVLCAGLVFAVLATPLRGQIEQTLEQVFNRDQKTVRIERNRVEREEEPQQEEGILVARVVSGSPADEAGVRRGDILLEVDGEPVNTLADLRAVLRDYQAGDEIELLVQRGDARHTLTAVLSQGTGESAFLGIQPGQAASILEEREDPRLELQFEMGARITEVSEGSPAEKAGLEAGDTILSVDGETFKGNQDLADIIAGHEPGDTVTLEVAGANDETREVTVRLGENPDKAGASWLGIRYELVMSTQMEQLMPGNPALPEDQQDLPAIPDIPFSPDMLQSGAVIQEVVDGSPAEEAGLRAGQILHAVDDQPLQRPQDLSEAILGHQPGDEITLTLFDPQTGETRNIEVTLGENPDKAGAAWLGIQYTFMKLNIEQEELPEG